MSDNQASYDNLRSFIASSTLKTIGQAAFYGASSLTEISLNDGLEELGAVAFVGTGVQELDIPANVTFGNAVFAYCTSLNYLWVPRSVTQIDHATIDSDYTEWSLINWTGCIIGYKGTIAEKYVECWDGNHGYPGNYPTTFHAIDGDAHEGTRQMLTASTCETAGLEQLACDICGTVQTRELAATGHAWDDGVVNVEPTATADGARTYTCSTCGTTRAEAIAALGTAVEAAQETERDGLPRTGDGFFAAIVPLALSLLPLSAGAISTATRSRRG